MFSNIISSPIVLILLVIIILFVYKKDKETYSPASMIQLTAKGPQDTYLSGDAWKYIPPWYYGYGKYGGWNSRYPWYISTRLGKKPYYWW